jgi:hypothetical protein
MHRDFRPEEGFLCCMRAMTANRLYYLRSLKYKEETPLKSQKALASFVFFLKVIQFSQLHIAYKSKLHINRIFKVDCILHINVCT